MEIILYGLVLFLFYGIIRNAVEAGTYNALVKYDKYKNGQNNKVE